MTRPPARLLYSTPEGEARASTLGELTRIGRAANSDLVIEDSSVSRRHALIQRQEDGAHVLTDLGSANGTTLNDRLIHLPVVLRDGDRIGIAGYDKAPSFLSTGPVLAEHGLGTVAEFERTRAIAPDHWIKIALPGPLTFASFIQPGERSKDVLLEELVAIVEEMLRPRYGGSSVDYQWAEQQVGRGKGRLLLRVSPAVGAADPERIVGDVLDELSRGSRAGGTVASVWREAGTVSVAREKPRLTAAGKTLPFMREAPA